MGEFRYANVVVDGKPLGEWLKEDAGMVNYEKNEFGHNVSTNPDYVIYDLGKFLYDPSVRETRYQNGVDLARVAASVHYWVPYHEVDDFEAINGDDLVRIFFNALEDVTVTDFILNFFKILDGEIYISKENFKVYVKGRIGSDEERKAVIDDYARRLKQK